MSTGGRRADRQGLVGSTPLPSVVATLLGAVLSGVAWVYLVRAAIDFGRLARDGQSQAWLFTGAASLGAVVCLFLLLVLVTRALRAFGIISDYKPRRAAARRRADQGQRWDRITIRRGLRRLERWQRPR